jgi:hypothetical protein
MNETRVGPRRDPGGSSLAYGLATSVVLVLVFAAFDDITTDNATSFRAEYSALIAAAAWLFVVALRLMRRHQPLLGGISLVALAVGVWGQRGIGPGIVPGFWPHYVATIAAYAWFWALTLVLLWRGLHARHPATQS